MAQNFDRRTGKRLREGTSIDYSGIKDPSLLRYDENSGELITSQSLNASKTLTLPEPTISSYGGLDGFTESLVVNQKNTDKQKVETRNNEQQRVDLLRSNVSKSGRVYLDELLNSGSIKSSVDRAEQDKAKQESDKYLAMLEQEQLANRRTVERLRTEFKGTTAGLSNVLEAENRKSLSKQADIAILQTAANRNYDTAKEIADRTVQMKLEESAIKLSALKFFYEENKSAFDKADDRLFQQKLKDEERAYDKQQKAEEEIAKLKVNVAQYAGSSALGILNKLSDIDATQSGALDEAIKIAGKYATDPLDRELKQLQVNKLKAPSAGEVPTIKQINGVDKQWNPKTGQWEEPTLSGTTGAVDSSITEKSFDDIKTVRSVINNNTGISASAGLKNFSINPLNFNKINDWRANVKNILSQTTLAELVRVKGSGVTFGALSEGERRAVSDASSALNAAMVYTGEGENRVATGKFNASESFVKEKLGLIQKYAEIDFKRRTGMTPDEYEAEKYLNSISTALEVVGSPYAGYLAPK